MGRELRDFIRMYMSRVTENSQTTRLFQISTYQTWSSRDAKCMWKLNFFLLLLTAFLTFYCPDIFRDRSHVFYKILFFISLVLLALNSPLLSFFQVISYTNTYIMHIYTQRDDWNLFKFQFLWYPFV